MGSILPGCVNSLDLLNKTVHLEYRFESCSYLRLPAVL